MCPGHHGSSTRLITAEMAFFSHWYYFSRRKMGTCEYIEKTVSRNASYFWFSFHSHSIKIECLSD